MDSGLETRLIKKSFVCHISKAFVWVMAPQCTGWGLLGVLVSYAWVGLGKNLGTLGCTSRSLKTPWIFCIRRHLWNVQVSIAQVAVEEWNGYVLVCYVFGLMEQCVRAPHVEGTSFQPQAYIRPYQSLFHQCISNVLWQTDYLRNTKDQI